MSMRLRLIAFLILSIAAAFAINEFGFGIAHSVPLGLVAFLLSPGILVFFVSERLGSTGSWAAFILGNVIYYEVIYRAGKWIRREKR
ncbi:hypothetical protein GCM10027318_14300 [Massilia agilis]